MAEPTSTATATIAVAASTIPVLTILGIPLGVRPAQHRAGNVERHLGCNLDCRAPAVCHPGQQPDGRLHRPNVDLAWTADEKIVLASSALAVRPFD